MYKFSAVEFWYRYCCTSDFENGADNAGSSSCSACGSRDISVIDRFQSDGKVGEVEQCNACDSDGPMSHIFPFEYEEIMYPERNGMIIIDRIVKVPEPVEFIEIKIEAPKQNQPSSFWKKYED